MSKLKVNECKKKRNFNTLSNHNYNYRKAKLEFVSYGKFKDIEFIAEGGFSKIYKATWIDGPISNKWNEEKQEFDRCGRMIVVLKELNNSNNIDSKELNENFFNISWKIKLKKLLDMIGGLKDLHNSNIIHQDYHSGNIFRKETKGKYKTSAITGDFGISKSAIGSSDDDNEVYGIIPYVAPEIFQGQKYIKASDIYSYGMIIWELMTALYGRRLFWDKCHDINLNIEICDGLRPPIVTNAPEGYIELMQECWHSDPNKRPNVREIRDKFTRYGAIYKSRPLSTMIKSVKLTKSLKSQSIIPEFGKRKFNNNLIENNNDDNVKKTKLCENKNDGTPDYTTEELNFDI
ncbi:kinase-like domain-containing protein [Rhizophagus diaphanus]|nr:kinase-like domain-containing protein [Rhizophagus diaphanus] [Rhizophagus sp. MUCL 43196]